MSVKTVRRATAARDKNDERLAHLIDHLTTALGVMPCGVSPTEAVAAMGLSAGLIMLRNFMDRMGVTADGAAAAAPPLPARSWMALRGEHGDKSLQLTKVEPLPITERLRLVRLGVLPSRVQVIRRGEQLVRAGVCDISDSDVRWEPPQYFLRRPGESSFPPIHPPIISSGRTRRRTGSMGAGGGRYVETNDMLAPEAFHTVRFAVLATWVEANLWRVTFRLPGAPGLWVPTDAAGARELLRLRDREPGRSRRSALLHWVSSHIRRGRGESEEIEVRRYLRGREECDWFGLRCTINPACERAK